jgi:hypothetical protein
MHRTIAGFATIIIVVLAGCASSESPEPAPAKPAAKPAPAPAAPSEEKPAAIVIKGSKRDDGPRDVRADDEADAARQARIEQLKQRAAADNVTGDWKYFDCVAGKFSVLVPRRPEERQQSRSDGRGNTIVVNQFIIGTEDRGFAISYSDLPGPLRQDRVSAALVAGANAEAAVLNGRVLETRSLTVEGSPALDARIAFGKDDALVARTRVVFATTRCYEIQAFMPAAEADSRDVSRFIESFKLKP